MRSFKALMFLTLAAALSCGANGSPTNVTTDGYPTTPSAAVLADIMNSLQDIANLYFKQYKDGRQFTKEYVNRLAWVRPYNYVVCDVGHNYRFEGIQGQDWDHKHITYPDIGNQPLTRYDVAVGGSGWLEKGSNNWAWNGFVAANQDSETDNNYVTFVKPPTGKQAAGSSN